MPLAGPYLKSSRHKEIHKSFDFKSKNILPVNTNNFMQSKDQIPSAREALSSSRNALMRNSATNEMNKMVTI